MSVLIKHPLKTYPAKTMVLNSFFLIWSSCQYHSVIRLICDLSTSKGARTERICSTKPYQWSNMLILLWQHAATVNRPYFCWCKEYCWELMWKNMQITVSFIFQNCLWDNNFQDTKIRLLQQIFECFLINFCLWVIKDFDIHCRKIKFPGN